MQIVIYLFIFNLEVNEIHDDKSEEVEELDELENIRREVEMLKESSEAPRKIQIPMMGR
jgi:hypothetical protein